MILALTSFNKALADLNLALRSFDRPYLTLYLLNLGSTSFNKALADLNMAPTGLTWP